MAKKHFIMAAAWILMVPGLAYALHATDPFGWAPYITCPIMTKAEWAQVHDKEKLAWILYGGVAFGTTAATFVLWLVASMSRVRQSIPSQVRYLALYGLSAGSGFLAILMLYWGLR